MENLKIYIYIYICVANWEFFSGIESNALNSWKLNIFKIIDGRISFYCNNLDLLPP